MRYARTLIVCALRTVFYSTVFRVHYSVCWYSGLVGYDARQYGRYDKPANLSRQDRRFKMEGSVHQVTCHHCQFFLIGHRLFTVLSADLHWNAGPR